MVKQVNPRDIVVMNQNKELETVPYGLLVWAAGNKARPLVADLIKKLPSEMQTQRRGLVVDDFLRVKGSEGSIFALGDASATKFAPTAQVANKQGQYLAALFNSMGYLETEREAMTAKGVTPEQVMNLHPPFVYEGLGMLAYIGNDKAVADFPGGAHFGGLLTFYFWRSAYLSNLFSWRNKLLVSSDWVKKTVFGRDIGRE
jgi:NADH:ubiquinone reductase (non-electrogenic)